MIRFRQINVRLDCCSSERTDRDVFCYDVYDLLMDGWCVCDPDVSVQGVCECLRRAGVILLAAVTHKLTETPAASPVCVLRKHRHPEHESSRS